MSFKDSMSKLIGHSEIPPAPSPEGQIKNPTPASFDATGSYHYSNNTYPYATTTTTGTTSWTTSPNTYNFIDKYDLVMAVEDALVPATKEQLEAVQAMVAERLKEKLSEGAVECPRCEEMRSDWTDGEYLCDRCRFGKI